MPRFSTGTAEQPNKLNQRFSFSGKVRGADVLRQLVGTCGYEVVREALEKLKPEPIAPPVVKRRRARKASND